MKSELCGRVISGARIFPPLAPQTPHHKVDLFGNPVDQSIVTEIYDVISNNPRSRSYYGGGLNKNDNDDELGIEVTIDDTGKGCCLGGEESPTGVDELAGCCWTSSVDVVTDEF